jgi:hypothetical protein
MFRTALPRFNLAQHRFFAAMAPAAAIESDAGSFE